MTPSTVKAARTPSRDPVLSANERFPELEDIVTSPIQRRLSRFDDPFYAFQRETKYPDLDDLPDALPNASSKPAPSFAYPTLPNPVKPLDPVTAPPSIPDRSRQPISQNPYPIYAPSSASLTYTAPIAYGSMLSNSASNYPGPTQVTQQSVNVSTSAPNTTPYQSTLPLSNYSNANTVQRPGIPPAPTSQPPTQAAYAQPRPQLTQEPLPVARPLSQSRSVSHDQLSKHSAVPTSAAPPLRIETQAPVPPTRPKIIHRSSSPSTSPTTQRFYGTSEVAVPPVAPPVPPKPRISRTTSRASLEDESFSLSQLSSSNLGIAGLKNLGNSCFLSSIVQCLSGTMPLARFFLGTN